MVDRYKTLFFKQTNLCRWFQIIHRLLRFRKSVKVHKRQNTTFSENFPCQERHKEFAKIKQKDEAIIVCHLLVKSQYTVFRLKELP